MGQKQKAEEKERERKKERTKVGNNNGQVRIANATSGGAPKATWAKKRIMPHVEVVSHLKRETESW